MKTTRVSEFYPELEATRGIAAALVAGFHVSQSKLLLDSGGTISLLGAAKASTSTLDRWFSHILDCVLDWQAPVLYFFVLSGFVLAGSLARNFTPSVQDALRFASARAFRIYPAVIFTVAVFLIWYLISGLSLAANVYDALTILKNMLLLDVQIDGVMWSMQVEMLAVPLLFLAFIVWNKGSSAGLILLVILMAALSFWGDWIRLLTYPGGPSRSAPLYGFLIGVLVYAKGRELVEFVGAERCGLWIFAATLGFFVAPVAIGAGSRWTMLVVMSSSGLIIALLAFGKSERTSSLLSYYPIRLLGRVSYSFYLLHPLSLTVLWFMPATMTQIVHAGISPSVLIVALWAVTVIAILPLACISYRFVELPGIGLGRWLLSKQRRVLRTEAA